ncbi:Phytosulfokines 3 [Ananas comosus]|uniref:Phytosulfokine n=1 Tax=Ananas comosus TaxID=4615 RepID=A0A199V4G8_ANACO|nr:Phytosulfokines 3 [Ananas comosus]
MSKRIALVFIAFLLIFVTLTEASRHVPVDSEKGAPEGVEEGITHEKVEGCEGVGEEECLMRRTLSAHTDYIYTQEKHN